MFSRNGDPIRVSEAEEHDKRARNEVKEKGEKKKGNEEKGENERGPRVCGGRDNAYKDARQHTRRRMERK